MSQKKETYIKYRNEKGRYTKKSHKVENTINPITPLLVRAIYILISREEKNSWSMFYMRLVIWVIIFYLIFLTAMQQEVLIWIGGLL